MRFYLLTILWFALSPVCLPAQSAVEGKVLDAGTGEALAGANIVPLSNWRKGSQTDSLGRFSLRLDTLPDTLLISYIGYLNEKRVIGGAGETLIIRLEPTASEMEAVTVKATRLAAREFASRRLGQLDIYLTPGAKADPLLAIDAMPASTTPNETANISLRGSPPGATGAFINGIPVNGAVRLDQANGVGQFSIFNTATVEEVQVYASNPPLELGNSAGGAIAIRTRSEIPERQNQLSLNLAGAGALISRSLGESSGLTIYGNFQAEEGLKALNPAAFSDLENFRTTDVGLHYVQQFTERLHLRLFNLTLLEAYDYRYRDPSHAGIYRQEKRRNLTVANLEWRKGPLRLSWNQGVDWSRARYRFGNLDIRPRQLHLSGNALMNWSKGGQILKGGVAWRALRDQENGQYPTYDYALGPEHPATRFRTKVRVVLPEVFIYAKRTLGDRWALGGGIRWRPNTDGVRSVTSYQVNTYFRPGTGHRFVLAGGQYHHYTQRIQESSAYELLRSRQLSLDYRFKRDGWEVSSAVYRSWNAFQDTENPIFGGEIYGAYRKGCWSGSLSLSTVESRLKSEQTTYPSSYDLPYYLRAMLQWENPRFINISLLYKQRSGQYYRPVLGAEKSAVPDVMAPIYAPPDAGRRLPDYRLLDLNVSRMLPLGNGGIILYGGVGNLFNFGNVREYTFPEGYDSPEPAYFNRRAYFFGLQYQWN